ncbi:hypothetical protein U732_3774 [Clostridium argentinense CDC 2741]|uniref:Uncharacterized protein n=1 Tax=Clostridium argentinense CDC 2741 TaxID=1418104 RepID=A0A0C1U5P2_9CLOT|nr:hypothetical protein [Clostridium argentinense]ARC85218.1 hypothetical protein RSJ17_12265 [Clostridium argentinense]KIE48039.1 hypothetical protein U732_3774 [Clostridium argentinense CDC 2741]NFF39479.1 hypothetical protein [Clostridium argentinense]NFP50974.1 hypothetical protein [Clostridium argentinense]NFP73632.1 hypothetical protein [Clostridium argentinense]
MKQLHYATGSREIKYTIELLNKHDIKIGELEAEMTGSIRFDSLAEIKRMANLTVKEKQFKDIDLLNDRIRPVFQLKMPDGGYASWNMGVFLISSPTRKESGANILRDLELYDKSLILKEDKFENRYLVSKGTNYVEAVINIINKAGISKVYIKPTNSIVDVDKEYEIGTNKLEVINSLLKEINYTSLWVDEAGVFRADKYLIPTEREADYTYRDNQLSIIETGSIEELDLFSVANKWIVVASNPEKEPLISKYENVSATSPISIPNRGRTIVDYRTVDDIADQVTLDAYTKCIAYEASQVYGEFRFNTAIMPHHSYADLLFIDHKGMGINSKFTEMNWRINIGSGNMEHTCRKVVYI